MGSRFCAHITRRDVDLLAEDQDKMLAGIDMLRRTGAEEFQVRFQDDPQPTIWFATATYKVANGEVVQEASGAMDPVTAVLRLCETIVDGGMCAHCKKPTGFEPHDITPMPGEQLWCWYQYDPELKKYRRSCEGDER